jgi:hypothetical protein
MGQESGIPEEATAEEVHQQEIDAFEAGFKGEEVATPVEPEPAEEEQVEQPPEDVPEVEAAVLAGLTETQIKELFAKAARVDSVEQELRAATARTKQEVERAWGKFGEVQREIQNLQKERAAAGSFGDITEDDFRELAEEYPDLAKLQLAGLKRMFAKGGGGQAAPAFDMTEFDQRLQQQQTATDARMGQMVETRLLSVMQPDWKDVVASSDFTLWKQTLDQESRQQLESTWDASYISGGIDAFRKWKDDQKQGQQRKQDRLLQAVAPQGVRAQRTTADEVDAFNAGFASARGFR